MAMTVIGALLLSCRRRPRDSEALRIRKRYLRWLDLQVRPRLTVDQHDVAVEARVALVVVHEAAVGGEHLVRDHDRQVVVALRDRQRVLELVAHEVHRGQAHVGVLGRVVHAVVVVPERARLLVVRELVGLALADPGDVAGVAVVLRLRGRAVQVGRRPGLVAPVRVLRRQLVAHGHVQRRCPGAPGSSVPERCRCSRRSGSGRRAGSRRSASSA